MNVKDNREVGDPTWEVAHLFPNQGAWSVADYLALDTNRLVELSEGRLEVLVMPTEQHQLIVAFLYDALKTFVRAAALGKVLFAPLRIQLWEGRFREPDLVFLFRRTRRSEATGFGGVPTWSWKSSVKMTRTGIGLQTEGIRSSGNLRILDRRPAGFHDCGLDAGHERSEYSHEGVTEAMTRVVFFAGGIQRERGRGIFAILTGDWAV